MTPDFDRLVAKYEVGSSSEEASTFGLSRRTPLQNFQPSVQAQPARFGSVGGSLLFEPGTRILLAGKPGSGKSKLSRSVALDFLRQFDDGHVVIVDFENPPTNIWREFHRFGATEPEKATRISVSHGPGFNLRDACSIIAEFGDSQILVVFDSFDDLISQGDGDPNSARDVKQVWRTAVRPFVDEGHTALLLDHLSVKGAASGSTPLGSSHKIGGADIVYTLSEASGERTVGLLKDRLGFYGGLAPRDVAAFRFADDLDGHLRVEPSCKNDDERVQEQRFILGACRSAEHGCSMSLLEEEGPKGGCRKRRVKPAVDELLSAGKLVAQTRSGITRYVTADDGPPPPLGPGAKAADGRLAFASSSLI